jgi:hypothetical protein
MTTDAVERTQQILNSGDRAAWLSAALAVALDTSSPNAIRPAALKVLHSCGIDIHPGAFQRDRGAVAAQAAAPLLQSAALLRGDAGSGPTSPIRHFWRRAARVLKEPRLFARSGYP